MNPEELAKKIRNQYQPYNAATPIVRIFKMNVISYIASLTNFM